MSDGIFIISGEESGDLHGASLIDALKKLIPGIRIEGMGGERMRKAGLVGADSKEVSVVGIVEVVERLGSIVKTFNRLKRRLREGSFDAVVLIDFPDFNLRFAKEARRSGVPVIYYISPQVWAWRKGRIKTIARLVDKMLVVFPFEEELYRKAGVDVEYVGHPLAGAVESGPTKKEARAALGIPEEGTTVALLPGSRTGEVKRLLPPMLKGGELIERGLGGKVTFLLPAAESIEGTLLDSFLKESPLEVRALRGRMHTILRAADAAVVTSGTATLETALAGTPMVIIYKVAPVSYAIGRMLIGVRHIGLPNIVAGKSVVPELIQNEATPENIARHILDILGDVKKMDAMAGAYRDIRASLGGGGAAARAAKAIEGIIKGKKAAVKI